MIWWMIGLMAIGTIALKAAGPLAMGEREPSRRAESVIALFTPALLAALMLQNLADASTTALPGLILGLVVGIVALACRLSLIMVVLLAAGAAAMLRLAM